MPETETPPAAQTLPPVDPKIARMEAELADQKRLVNQLASQMPRPQAPPQSGVNMDDLNKEFYKNPVTTAAAIAAQAANEAIARHGQNGMDTLVQVAKDKAREQSKNPELFDKYSAEIEARVKATVDPQFHSNMNVWLSSANISFGEHMSEIRDAVRAEKPASPAIKISEGGPAAAGGQQAPALKGAAEGLSADEREMARNMDISPEQYAHGKEAVEKQAAKGPSSWDKYVTFSSKEARRTARATKRAAAAK